MSNDESKYKEWWETRGEDVQKEPKRGYEIDKSRGRPVYCCLKHGCFWVDEGDELVCDQCGEALIPQHEYNKLTRKDVNNKKSYNLLSNPIVSIILSPIVIIGIIFIIIMLVLLKEPSDKLDYEAIHGPKRYGPGPVGD